MAAWLKRFLPSLVLDALAVCALAFPTASAYLRWPLLALYALLSISLFKALNAQRWILRIVHDPLTRVVHGLEHATLAVLAEDGLPTIHGFTHGRDRFVVALAEGQAQQHASVVEAATRAIRRIHEGEHALAYQPGCGTSEAVSAVTLWLMYVASVLFTLVIGGSVQIFVAVSVVVFRIWLAWETPLGLLAQRLFTVSTAFSSATVIDVRETSAIGNVARPGDETWFEVVVDARLGASRGGLVSTGPLA
jgi:hypothetical protein